jgi:hypothetical protein
VPKELYDLVVVNHESDDPNTVAYLHEIAEVHRVVDYQGVFNFSKINNFAVTQLDGTYDSFLFMNNDVQAINAGWFESMRDKLGRKEVGIVGAVLLYPPDSKAKGAGVIGDAEAFDPSELLSDQVGSHGETQEVTLSEDIPKCKIQHAGVHLGVGIAEHYLKFEECQNSYLAGPRSNPAVPNLVTRSFSAVTAACMMTRADIFKKLGGFDEELAVGFQDVDLCLRAGNEGYKVLCDAEAILFHYESVSRSTDDFLERDPHPQDTSNFRSKYEHDIGRDPFYHPMLAYTTPQYRPLRSPQGQFLSGRVVTNLALEPYRTQAD